MINVSKYLDKCLHNSNKILIFASEIKTITRRASCQNKSEGHQQGTMTTSKKNKIQFGILVNLNINNEHYLQSYDRVKEQMQKIDTFYYISTFDRTGYALVEEMIDDYIKMFKDDAIWIKNLDGCGSKSNFHLVCYITDNDGKIVSMEKIKELFY